MTENNGPIVLFQGDSITDCGRDREDPRHLGYGYAAIAAALYQALYPEKNVTFLNRGIGGDTVPGLLNRWREDCLDLKPNVVSILIGINDAARAFRADTPSTPEDFDIPYHKMLTQAKESGAKLILMEPFLLHVLDDQPFWRKDLNPKIQVVRDLAREFGAALVPLDGIFAQAATRREPTFWIPEGVHPSPVGHALIAQAWLEVARNLI